MATSARDEAAFFDRELLRAALEVKESHRVTWSYPYFLGPSIIYPTRPLWMMMVRLQAFFKKSDLPNIFPFQQPWSLPPPIVPLIPFVHCRSGMVRSSFTEIGSWSLDGIPQRSSEKIPTLHGPKANPQANGKTKTRTIYHHVSKLF